MGSYYWGTVSARREVGFQTLLKTLMVQNRPHYRDIISIHTLTELLGCLLGKIRFLHLRTSSLSAWLTVLCSQFMAHPRSTDRLRTHIQYNPSAADVSWEITRRSILVQALERFWTISDTFQLKKGHELFMPLCSLAPFSSEYNFLRSVRQGDISLIADVCAPIRMYNKPSSLLPVPSLHQISEICLIFHKITKDLPLRWNLWQVEFLINFLNLKIKIC